jgi:hypothetical protein
MKHWMGTAMLRNFTRLLCACVALLIFAPHVAAQDRSVAEERMAGTWYGEFSAGGPAPSQRFLTTRRADGTFTLQARMYEGGKVVAEARNGGMWGISNGMYFTVTTEINGAPSDAKRPDAINAYLVKSVDADRFEYVHVATGNRFVVTRVDPARARLPD